MPASSAVAISAASASCVIIVPVGLAGLATSTPLSGACAVRRHQRLGRDRPARRRAGLDRTGIAAERREDVAVGRIAGHRDRDPVAGLEQAEKGEDEAARRAGGDDHPLGIDIEPIGFRVVAGDARAQRRDARAPRYSRAARGRAPPRAAAHGAWPARRPPAGRPPCGRRARPPPPGARPPPSRP